MEAITIVGAVLVAIGGYYSLKDLLHDLGIQITTPKLFMKPGNPKRAFFAPKIKAQKIAGQYI